jgi:hypothetical protein
MPSTGRRAVFHYKKKNRTGLGQLHRRTARLHLAKEAIEQHCKWLRSKARRGTTTCTARTKWGWGLNPEAMVEDDEHLQRNVALLRHRINGNAIPRNVHIYPSRNCTYTLDKRRIFVCVRDTAGALLPGQMRARAPRPARDCAVQHVLLHEFAHVVNRESVGHDNRFRAVLRRLHAAVTGTNPPCPDRVPPQYNAHCRRR